MLIIKLLVLTLLIRRISILSGFIWDAIPKNNKIRSLCRRSDSPDIKINLNENK